jgi:hypothetical protein
MVRILKLHHRGAIQMQTDNIIENIVTRELKALCGSCIHQHDCVYHKTSTRAIIQCELFELDKEQMPDPGLTLGLCTNCDHANHCTLPARKSGAWRCDEFS